MKYRPFGRIPWQASALGFGCMRLPTLDGKAGAIDEPKASHMLRYGIDRGINYIDTAYGYHDGQSEFFVGRALRDGYRQKVHLATKMPSWLIQSAADFDRYLDEQLGRLQTEAVDFYLLHALNRQRWAALRQLGVREWFGKAIASGRVGKVGFSFHDNYEVLEQVLNDYDGWTFCQIQYNYMDINEQARTRGLKLAADKGLAVVIMEPLLGGKLAVPPPSVQAILDESTVRRTPPDWALQWLWDQPEVSVVLSGMNTLQQVEENLVSAEASGVGAFTLAEQQVIEQVRQKYNSVCPIPCTKCQYCLPCPNGVDIPRNFELFNKGAMLDIWSSSRFRYTLIPAGERAGDCAKCYDCEDKCPQHIAIRSWLEVVHGVLAQGQEYDGHTGPSPR